MANFLRGWINNQYVTLEIKKEGYHQKNGNPLFYITKDLIYNFEQLNFKNQGSSWADFTTCSTLSISQIRRYIKFPF